jgi:hypothetical protein
MHQRNAPSHTSVITQRFLAKQKMAVILHPLYSPDFAPCDFFPFPEMKLKLKGRPFDTTEKIQAESQRMLDTLTGKDLQEAFQKWRRRWDRVYKREKTTSRLMAADRPYGEFYDFYSVGPEYFGFYLRTVNYTLVSLCNALKKLAHMSSPGRTTQSHTYLHTSYLILLYSYYKFRVQKLLCSVSFRFYGSN